MLQGIRLVKLCGWENEFIDRITDARNNELNLLDKDSVYWGSMSALTRKNFYVKKKNALISIDFENIFSFFNARVVGFSVSVLFGSILLTERNAIGLGCDIFQSRVGQSINSAVVYFPYNRAYYYRGHRK